MLELPLASDFITEEILGIGLKKERATALIDEYDLDKNIDIDGVTKDVDGIMNKNRYLHAEEFTGGNQIEDESCTVNNVCQGC